MIRFSNCKINLGLYITEKRTDGFHNLETLIYPIPLFDVIESIPGEQTSLSLFGQPIPGNIENNIVLKAWRLLKNDFPNLPSVHFYLLKNTPVGAGLGAGSANGAIALTLLNDQFNLKLNEKQLLDYALQLGSDCPFFILNKSCIASGRGEKLEEISLDLSAYKIVIVNPSIHISTPWAFSQITPKSSGFDLHKIVEYVVEDWKDLIVNDFEESVTKEYLEIDFIKKTLYNKGASFALMSGSGSTVYGLFRKEQKLTLNFSERYFIKTIDL